LVDHVNFQALNQDHWLEDKNGYVYRVERKGGKTTSISMAREILGLLRSVGYNHGVADHKNHDEKDNVTENLRVVTQSQNGMNQVKSGSCQRFKGVTDSGSKYRAYIHINDSTIYFPSVSTDIEAGFMHWYAAVIIYGEFAYTEGFPEAEWPKGERQQELWGMVIERLKQGGFLV
jgi:hypothetical protein